MKKQSLAEGCYVLVENSKTTSFLYVLKPILTLRIHHGHLNCVIGIV